MWSRLAARPPDGRRVAGRSPPRARAGGTRASCWPPAPGIWVAWVPARRSASLFGDLVGDPVAVRARRRVPRAVPGAARAPAAGGREGARVPGALRLAGNRQVQAALLGAAIALVLTPFTPEGVPIVAASLACLLGLLPERRPEVAGVSSVVASCCSPPSGTIALKGAGPVLLGGRPLPPRLDGVVTARRSRLARRAGRRQHVRASVRRSCVDERALGLAAAAVAIRLRAPALVGRHRRRRRHRRRARAGGLTRAGLSPARAPGSRRPTAAAARARASASGVGDARRCGVGPNIAFHEDPLRAPGERPVVRVGTRRPSRGRRRTPRRRSPPSRAAGRGRGPARSSRSARPRVGGGGRAVATRAARRRRRTSSTRRGPRRRAADPASSSIRSERALVDPRRGVDDPRARHADPRRERRARRSGSRRSARRSRTQRFSRADAVLAQPADRRDRAAARHHQHVDVVEGPADDVGRREDLVRHAPDVVHQPRQLARALEGVHAERRLEDRDVDAAGASSVHAGSGATPTGVASGVTARPDEPPWMSPSSGRLQPVMS